MKDPECGNEMREGVTHDYGLPMDVWVCDRCDCEKVKREE